MLSLKSKGVFRLKEDLILGFQISEEVPTTSLEREHTQSEFQIVVRVIIDLDDKGKAIAVPDFVQILNRRTFIALSEG